MFNPRQANGLLEYARRHGGITPHGAYQAARKGIDTTKDKRLVPAIKELLGLSGTQIIITDEAYSSGKGPAWYKEPEIYLFLCRLLEGLPVKIEEKEAKKKETKTERAKRTIFTWAPLETAENIGKILPKAGWLGEGVSMALTPPLLLAETIKSIKETAEKKNTILIKRKNFRKILPLLWVLKTNAEKNPATAVNLLFMGNIEFWKQRYMTNDGTRARQQYQEDLRAAIKERRAQGWVKDMIEAKKKMLAYDPKDFPEKHRQEFMKEIEGFKKWLDWSYSYAYHAFVEKDPKMRERTHKLWAYLCREYLGVPYPERYLEKAKIADKSRTGKAIALLKTETGKEMIVMGASLGWMTMLYIWSPWGGLSAGSQIVLNLASYAAFDLV